MPPPSDPNAQTLPPDEPDPNAATIAPDPPGPSADFATLPPPDAVSGSVRRPLPEVPGYDIEAELGRGGMGVVYRGRQRKLNRPVALKMILSADQADPRELVRFLAEAEAVAAIRHPHVVQVYEYGDCGGQPFLAMEYLDGGNLSDLLRGGPLPFDAASVLVERLALAIQAAHDLGIVHRDLKPANILLGKQSGGAGDSGGSATGRSGLTQEVGLPGSNLVPKITDFGLAKRGNADLTRTGAIMGTPAYMAPEQARGQTKFVGPGADIYALGVILFECLTGRPPFAADDTVSLIMKVAEEEPPPVRSLRPDAPRDLAVICHKCLHKDPKRRYASAAQLAEDLRRQRAGEAITARQATTWERLRRWVRKNPVPATAAAAGLVLVGAAAGFLVYDAGVQREQAEQFKHLSDEALKSAAVAREQRSAAQDALAASDAARKQAQAAEAAAEDARKAAEASRRAAVDHLYATSIDLAYREWTESNVYRAEQLLNDTPADRRGWEWQFVRSLLRPGNPVLRGHLHGVGPLAVSADGAFLASEDANWGARLWDFRTGRELVAAENRYGPLAFAPQGDTLFLIDGGTPTLFAAADLRKLGTLPVDGVAAARFADGGKTLLLVSRTSGAVTRWDVATQAKLSESPAKLPKDRLATWMLQRPDLSADGKHLLVGFEGGTVEVWDVATGKLKHTFLGTPMHVSARACAPAGPLVAGGFPDGMVYVWDADAGKELLRVRGHDGMVEAVAFSPDGKWLATGAQDMAVKVWDVKTGLLLRTFRGHVANVWGLAFTPDGKRLVSGSADRSIRVWDLDDRRHFGVFRQLMAMNFASRFAGLDFLMQIPQGSSGHRTFYSHMGPTRVIAFSPDGSRVYTSNNGDGNVAVWHLAPGPGAPAGPLPQTGKEFSFGIGSLGGVATAPDGKHVACYSATRNGGAAKLTVVPVGGREEVVTRSWPAPKTNAPPRVAYSADGKHLAGVLKNVTSEPVRVWEAATGKEIATLPWDGMTAHTVAFTPEGDKLVVAGPTRVRVYDWPSRKLARDLPASNLACFAVGPNGLAASGYTDGFIELVDLRKPDGRLTLRKLEGHVGQLHSLAFHPDGSRLVSAGNELAVKIWSTTTGHCLLTFRDMPREIEQVAWSGDGRHVAACGWDGTLRLWSVPAADPDSTENWKVLLRETFDKPDAVTSWFAKAQGKWRVENGAVRGEMTRFAMAGVPGAGFQIATLPLPTRTLPRTFELRYTVWSPTPKLAGNVIMDPASSMNIQPLLGAPGNGVGHVGAFVLVMDKATAGGGQIAGVPRGKFKFEAGRKYVVRVVRDKTLLRMTVDGETILEESVPAREATLTALSAAWGNAGDAVYFDDVEVRAPEAALKERDLMDRFEGWVKLYRLRTLVAEEIAAAKDLTPADRLVLRPLVAGVPEDLDAIQRELQDVLFKPGRPADEYGRARRVATAAYKSHPDNWPLLMLRAAAEYRTGDHAAALATAAEADEIFRQNNGTPAPSALRLTAVALHAQGKVAEARVAFRRVEDMLYGEYWRKNAHLPLHAEAAAIISLPPDPDGDAIRKLVLPAAHKTVHEGDVAATAAAYAPDAVITYGRGPTPDAFDRRLPLADYLRRLPTQARSTAFIGFRSTYDRVACKVEGDAATFEYDETLWVGIWSGTWAHRLTLKRTPAGWRVTTARVWTTALSAGGPPTPRDAAYYAKKDAELEKASAPDWGRVKLLIEADRPAEAYKLAESLAAKETPTYDELKLWGEAAYLVADEPTCRGIIRRIAAAGPLTPMPWFASRRLGRYEVAATTLFGLDVSPDGRDYAAGGHENALTIRTANTPTERYRDAPFKGNVSDVRYSHDGKRVAAVASDGQLAVWDAAAVLRLWAKDLSGPYGQRLAWSPDGTRIVSTSTDTTAHVVDAATGAVLARLTGHTASVMGCDWSPDGKWVVTVTTDGVARVYDAADFKTAAKIVRFPGQELTRVRFRPDGKECVVTGKNGLVATLDPAAGKMTRRFSAIYPAHNGVVEPVVYTPDGTRVVSAGPADDRIVIWEAATGKPLEVIEAGHGGIFGLAVTPDGKELLSAGVDGVVRRWTLAPW